MYQNFGVAALVCGGPRKTWAKRGATMHRMFGNMPDRSWRTGDPYSDRVVNLFDLAGRIPAGRTVRGP